MKIFGENLFQTRLSLAKKGTVETLCMVLVPLMVLLAAGSCEKPETPNEGNNALGYPIDVSFAEYSLTGTSCQWKNLNSNGTVIVINSGEDLENYIDGSYPEIDFSKQTLLLVGGSANSGISQISKSLQQLSGNEYKLDVELTLNEATATENWVISVLVPKLAENAKIKLVLNIQEIVPNPSIIDSLKGDWTWFKRYGGFVGKTWDNEFKSVIKILSQNADASINYEVFVEDTLFYQGSFQIQHDQWNRIFANIKLPHDICRDVFWQIFFGDMLTRVSDENTLCFMDGAEDGYMYYYQKIEEE